MQLPASYELQSVVKHYLFVNTAYSDQSFYRFFSDGNPGIVFHLNTPLSQVNNLNIATQLQPQSFIYGQITHYNNIILNGDLSMLIVVLQPYGINSLLGLAASELNNTVVKLTDVFKQDAADLEDQLLSSSVLPKLISLIESFLLKQLTAVSQVDSYVKQAVDIIYQKRGIVPIQYLTKALPITERQLERKFKHDIGTSPKKFVDIIRFQFFLKSLQNSPSDKAINDIIYSYGFYDQAHLNKCFKINTGLTPMQYKAKFNPSVINFMQV
ncbi:MULTISPECIES: helix-turn-helix domain-containing protein [unclassified Mucilaginibacter]|uniref:helix-turn-helix domain-containing protein n=1 Tax=unclassified Mucilaginibacter TaxID=2617802 RepID=UPI002AC9665A|nr:MULTISPECIES: helix-turn-helix domain-containing protein [unclassified Mucilaginibacter]MEB0261453.1 helix-turn-helix domain-containing protein [Mucilaginibacter sp. 10I4]MEB0276961.1 helix-turn-helix domain-containing protein [Mucilaginibacter sp. 10B2]MEB0301516.1 helix-turn-helix domain-containing protein [Mucilaginibacter sp. 5C4]WPX25061.1 helix-turn-helix domain-containing protein [Mucilaginibacter sp. 5C4]